MFFVFYETIVDTTIQDKNISIFNYRNIYFWLNSVAVTCHVVNAVGIVIAYIIHLSHIKQGYAFVSPVVPLRWTNHALIMVDSTTAKCKDVEFSPHFQASNPIYNNSMAIKFIPQRDPYPDFMKFFDFTNTDIIQYNYRGVRLNLNIMILSFFILSAVFQTVHGILLYNFSGLPRFLHYLEYAFSSPLMVMVMAVEVGMDELFIVTSMGGLFFGMNIAGMGSEVLTHFTGYIIDQAMQQVYIFLIWTIHFAGWVLFLMAMVPIWAQFHQVLTCSENGGTPDYVYALIVIESALFFIFGFVQTVSILEKLQFVSRLRNICNCLPIQIPVHLLFKYDCVHATLSLIAKTILAWLLLGPALSVDISVLRDRVNQ
jgi:hypothetical protein